jgi:hypothetical protein
MKTSNLWLLLAAIITAGVPWTLLLLPDRLGVGGDNSPIFAGFVWLAIAVTYYLRLRTKSALWIFVLAPIAFGPLIFFSLLYMGAVFGYGP